MMYLTGHGYASSAHHNHSEPHFSPNYKLETFN
jgi:hypothetical protein